LQKIYIKINVTTLIHQSNTHFELFALSTDYQALQERLDALEKLLETRSSQLATAKTDLSNTNPDSNNTTSSQQPTGGAASNTPSSPTEEPNLQEVFLKRLEAVEKGLLDRGLEMSRLKTELMDSTAALMKLDAVAVTTVTTCVQTVQNQMRQLQDQVGR
jgi:hypothetical protein